MYIIMYIIVSYKSSHKSSEISLIHHHLIYIISYTLSHTSVYRSFIRDPIVGNGGTLPLFKRNVEKERFERGVIWLKRIVEQLLLSRGVNYDNNQHVLSNIYNLLKYETSTNLNI